MLYLNQHSVMCLFLQSGSVKAGVYVAKDFSEAYEKVRCADSGYISALRKMPKRGCIIVVAPEEKMATTIRDPQTWDQIDALLTTPAHLITHVCGGRPTDKMQCLMYNRTMAKHRQPMLSKSHVLNLLATANLASEQAPVLKGVQYA